MSILRPERLSGGYEQVQISEDNNASRSCARETELRPYGRQGTQGSWLKGPDPTYTAISNDSPVLRSLLEEEKEQQSRPAPEHKKLGTLLRNWWKEAPACFLMVAAVAATIGTLYPYQGRPTPQWPYAITVNALLSTYMVVMKAAATFPLTAGIAQQKWKWFDGSPRPLCDLALHDEATRGPLGAIILLRRVSIRHVWHWLGCLMIVLVLFVDPFTQQVLHYSDCNIPHPFGVATIPRSNIFMGNGTHVGAGLISITSREQAALEAGVVAPGGQVDIRCSSGNCTFPDFETIGYCSRCIDLSQEIQVRVQDLVQEGALTSYRVNTSIPAKSPQGPDNFFEVDPELSNLYEPWNGTNYATDFAAFGVLSKHHYRFLVGVLGPEFGVSTADDFTIRPYDPLGRLQTFNCSDAATNNTWRCHATGYAECSLYPCIKTYNATVTNGILHETRIAESPLNFDENVQDSDAYTAVNTSCLLSSEKHFLTKDLNYTIGPNSLWVPYNFSGNLDYKGKIPAYISNSSELNDFEYNIQSRGCVYGLSMQFDLSLGVVYANSSWTGSLTGYRNNYGGLSRFSGPQILQTLYNWGDFSFERTQDVFKNISESLTRHMRQSGLAQNGYDRDDYNFTRPSQGQAYVDKTCLSVQWAWLNLPAVLIVGTWVFFAATTLIGRGNITSEARTWKSSILPLIFCGPQQQSESRSALRDVQEMERFAARMDVQLVKEDGGAMYLHEYRRDAQLL
ncbi:Hypothetical predicted protein [Lecanosticta acicola]|uniref:Uncharacterized protein n=1 Tax=Lecanosticta acicola TaxID=111012 RepID=A0AAI9E9W5_9PEZI|nr:Hypothetical predicted protein [Lecanosticta acicola]